MPTPNTTKEVEEVARNLGHEIIAAIKDFQENGKGTLWLDRIILKHINALTAKHEVLDPVRVGMLRQWINEDRIINNPNKKLITNEDIVFWLTPTKTNKTTDV